MQQVNSSSSNGTIFNSGAVVPCIVTGMCCLVGVIGNVCVVAVIGRKFRKVEANFTLKLVVTLAASDILSLITLPVWIHSWLYGWTLGVGACRFFSHVVISGLYCSVITVTLMSVQRYVAVLYTRQWLKLRGAGETTLLVGVWVLGGILASPALVLGDVMGEEMRCRWKYSSKAEMVVTISMETLWGFIVPFSILLSSYFCLHKKVNQTAFFSSKRMTTLVTSIVVTFFVLWSPLHIVNILGITATLLDLQQILDMCETGWAITQAFTFINSCVNPFLYAFAYRKRTRQRQTEQSASTQYT